MPISMSRGTCCFPFGLLNNTSHRVISLNDSDALDFELVEFRPKRRLRVIHILPWAYRNPKVSNSPTPRAKISPQKSEDSGISSHNSSQSWVKNTSNDGEHPGNIWLYYERPVNYIDKLFWKIPSPALLENFSKNLSNDIINQACKQASSTTDVNTDAAAQRSMKPIFHKENYTRINKNAEHTEDTSLNLPGTCVEPEKSSVDETVKKCNKKPILLFIHDIGYSADIWKDQVIYFSSIGYEILAVDLIGHGLSSAPSESMMYSFREMTKDIIAIIDSYCLRNQPCVLIAHGYGCEIASKIAAHRQIQQMVFVGFGYKSEYGSSRNVCSSPRFNTSLVKKYFQKKRVNNKRCLPNLVLKQVMSGRPKDLDSWFYRSIITPTLIVHGLKDLEVEVNDADEMDKLLPRSYLELVLNGSHLCMEDSAESFNSVVHYFLKTGAQLL